MFFCNLLFDIMLRGDVLISFACMYVWMDGCCSCYYCVVSVVVIRFTILIIFGNFCSYHLLLYVYDVLFPNCDVFC